ncbi:MAG: sugar ABC transporter permease [Devosia sp. 67-54]|nr:MAG: sugar ABC transporter permease [Devosia sp. 67-54]
MPAATSRSAPPPAAARAGLSNRQREMLAGYLFVAPDFLGLLVFVGLPMLLALTMGFFDVNGFGQLSFVGLTNYQKMLADQVFWRCLGVTLTYMVLLVPSLYVSGLGLALLVQRSNRFNTVMRAMFFAPQMVSLVVIGLVWLLLSSDKVGLLPRLLAMVGITGISLLGSPNVALYTTLVVTVWFLMGFYMLIFIGGLQDIPREYYEAAEIDGAGRIQSFWNITLPLLRPTSFFVLLISLVASVAGSQAFDLIYVMTKGGPANATSVLIFYVYQQAFQYSAFGYAAAMASIVVVLLLLATAVLFLMTRGGRFNYE